MRWMGAVFVAALCGSFACAQAPPPEGTTANSVPAPSRDPRSGGGSNRPADQPAPRTDRNSQIAHEQLVEKARKGGIDVYFIGKKIRFLNVNDKLADKDGKLFEGISNDMLHPNLKGYQIWADGLKPLFTEILGPPGRTDHAPPPTGDPSAKPSRTK